jgi:hypothetical protein
MTVLVPPDLVQTRNAMGQLVLDNLIAWFKGEGALTPVPETQVDRFTETLPNHDPHVSGPLNRVSGPSGS